MQNITAKEWNALLLTVQGDSDLQAYKKTFPNATPKTAAGAACRFFRRIREKLTQEQELALFDLGRGRFYRELEKRLDAQTPVFFQGKKIADIPDNTTRMKATDILAKINGVYNAPQESGYEQGEDTEICIVIENAE